LLTSLQQRGEKVVVLASAYYSKFRACSSCNRAAVLVIPATLSSMLDVLYDFLIEVADLEIIY